MANQIMSMNKLKQVIRFHQEGKSNRELSKMTGISRTTIEKYLSILKAHPYSMKELLGITDKELYTIVLPASVEKPCHEELFGLFLSMEHPCFFSQISIFFYTTPQLLNVILKKGCNSWHCHSHHICRPKQEAGQK